MTAGDRTTHWLGLDDRVVVVTGAGGGLGRAFALAFAEVGARLVLIDRDRAAAAETAAQIEALGVGASGRPRCISAAADVTDPASVEKAASQAVAAFGTIDVLVNNAALLRPGTLDSLGLAEWNALLAVNLTGYLVCAQAFAKPMRAAGGGALVHIASVSGSHPQGASGAYSVSKAGIIMLSRQLATEWGPAGIRSNVVSPGMVETPMSQAFYETPGVREKRSALVPLRRVAQPVDIAQAVLFLASARASYITGDEIVVDGGYTRMVMNMVPRPGYD